MGNPEISKKSGWVGNPEKLKGVGGWETLNPKRSGWVGNPEILRGVGGWETLKP